MRVAFIALILLTSHLALGQAEPVGRLLGPVPILQVVDGDTVVLQSSIGPRSVRLIGIDAPEMAHPERGREPFGPEARDALLALAPEGTLVWVELDAEHQDRYGRLLAYLYVVDLDGSWTVDGRPATMLNERMAEIGYATTMPIRPNLLYADLMLAAVRAARDAEIGMWAPVAQAPLPNVSPAPIALACALYNPTDPQDFNSEWVSILIHEPLDTRGYYLWDEGSRVRLDLPPGIQEPGELRIVNPGQGIWNNSGDTIYLKRGDEVVDQWDYREQLAPEGTVICRDGG